MKLTKLVLAAVLGTQAVSQTLRADATTDQIESLKQQVKQLTAKVVTLEQQAAAAKAQPLPAATADPRLDQLDQQVRVLERKAEIETEAAAEKARQAPRITIDSSGFTASSADTNFVLKLRGGFQVDGRFYPDNSSPANDTFLLRRVRPILEGTAVKKFDYRLMLDFPSGVSSSAFNNGNVLDAYINYRLHPAFQVQVGKFKEPVGLERLQSWNNLLFVERGLPTFLVPNRDTGVQLHGALFSDALNYQFGVFNGTPDGGSSDFDSDSDKDVAARLFAHPFKNSGVGALQGLGLGVSGTCGQHQGALRNYFTLGQQQGFTWLTGAGTNAATRNVTSDGTLWRLSPQAYYYWGPFGLLGEYVVSSHEVRRDAGGAPTRARLQNAAWQVAVSWFLTGEENGYKAVVPKRNFDPVNGGWGSLELAARVGQLDVDDDVFPLFADPKKSASGVFSWGVGLNWKLNRNIKLSLDYEDTDLDGAAGNPAPFKEEHVIFTRAQVAF